MTRAAKIVLSLAFGLAAGQALAHAQLQKATPAAGAAVAPPAEIRLEFSEGVEPLFSGVTLKAANGASEPLGRLKHESGDNKVLVVTISRPLSPGRYSVRWHAVSVDTHRTEGAFQFTVK